MYKVLPPRAGVKLACWRCCLLMSDCEKILGELQQDIFMMIPGRFPGNQVMMNMMKTTALSLFPFRAGYAD